MGLEVLVPARDEPRCRYQRLRGELLGDDGDGEEVMMGAAARIPAVTGSGGGSWMRARRPLRLRRRVGKKAAAAAAVPVRRRAPLLFLGGGKKARLMRLVLLVPARRVAALFAELVRRIASAGAAAAECPAIVFSSQWGLPVLSHSASGGAGGSRSARLRAFYLERSLSAGSGAGSPC